MILMYIFMFTIFILLLAVPSLYYEKGPRKGKVFTYMTVYSAGAAFVVTLVAEVLRGFR